MVDKKQKSVSFQTAPQKRKDESQNSTETKKSMKHTDESSEKLNPDAHGKIQFASEAGELVESVVEIPLSTPRNDLQKVLNFLLKQEKPLPYSFFVEEREITKDLNEVVPADFELENVITIVYQAQAVFEVQPVTRCTSSLSGHADPILCASFSPDGRHIASGSGDCTVRFWDTSTETPVNTGRVHTMEVLVTAWSPDGSRLASGCRSGHVVVWDPETGEQVGKSLKLHKDAVKAISWEPLHLSQDGKCNRLVSACRDGTARVWNVNTFTVGIAISGHLKSVNAVRWTGQGNIVTCSSDTTIRVWSALDGSLLRAMSRKESGTGHGHFVNCISINTDYVLRTGHICPRALSKGTNVHLQTPEERREEAKRRYNLFLAEIGGVERIVTGSEDRTLMLWEPNEKRKELATLNGHQQGVSQVQFSPNGRLIASASWDKTLRVWNGITGKFSMTLRGHVGPVYQLAWSADSRLVVSGSKDSTVKIWSIETKRILMDLPGHADAVYSLDWSPDGHRVVSGGKDNILKVWRR